MQSNPILCKLDRFVASGEWEDKFPLMAQCLLTRTVSDHSPLSLRSGGIVFGPFPFKVDTFWFEHPSFKEMMLFWWNSMVFEGSPSFIFAKKLQMLKAVLKCWSKEAFGNLDKKVRELEILIDVLDKKEEAAAPISDVEFVERASHRRAYNEVLVLIAKRWKLRAKVRWHVDGDRNTKIFHKVASGNRRKNAIFKLKIGSNEVVCQDLIKEEVIDFYEKLYSKDQVDDRKHFAGKSNFRRTDSFDYEIFQAKQVPRIKIGVAKSEIPVPRSFFSRKTDSGWDFDRNDLIDSRKREGKEGIVCKLDMEKAYDHVLWGQWRLFLGKWGSGGNGEDGYGIVSLLQGSQCKGRRGSETLKGLESFKDMTKLKVNLSKSSMMGIETQQDIIQKCAGLARCGVGEFPFSYLGIPIGASTRLIGVWNTIIERMTVRLAPWKRRYLSKARRVELINSTLMSIPLYYLSLFKIAVSVAKKLERLMRNFWWGDTITKKRLHWRS
ncbi:uncharacterized protein LOC113286536 [Papaver somniferum]|uniref:uncharacterized protein LOC113286536 n=1 Tax=Papaver somniferum TaxID=3469 RepID=UPI000E6F84D6|nr:uncharacterized protein LOC113286536 [Papaver somniferum]